MTGGRASDLMLGGNGNDFVHAVNDGADVVSGGDDRDIAFVDPSDTVTTVEPRRCQGRHARRQRKTINGDAGSDALAAAGLDAPEGLEEPASIEAIMFDGAKQSADQAHAGRQVSAATGKIASTTRRRSATTARP